MASWSTDSSGGFPIKQTNVRHQSSVKKSTDQLTSSMSFGIIKDITNIPIPPRIHSAPSTVGRVEKDHERKPSYQLQRQASCGDLIRKIRKVPSRMLIDDFLNTQKGVQMRLLLKLKRARTGLHSHKENVNIENHTHSLVKDSYPNVLKKDCPEESDKTTKGSRSSAFFRSLDSEDERDSLKRPRRTWFKRTVSKDSIRKCPEVATETGLPKIKVLTTNSVENDKSLIRPRRSWFKRTVLKDSIRKCPEVATITGLPKIKVLTTNPIERDKSHNTKSTEASVEKMKVYVSKTEKREEPVAIKKDAQNLQLPEESNTQIKLKNTGSSFDDSLKHSSTLEKPIRQKKTTLLKHPKSPESKPISIYDKDAEAESKSSVQYFYYNAKHFEHFHYVYNLTRDCNDRILKRLRRTNDRRNCMADDVVIKIGVVGEFAEEKLNFLSQRRGKREMPAQNQQIWEHSPLICFQKSAIELLRRQSACHKIFITTCPNQNETEKLDESINIIREEKEEIVRMISVCLEERIDQILKDWLVSLPTEGFDKHLPGIVDEIEDIHKELLFHDNQHTTVASTVVPSNLKEFLFTRHGVNSFGIWRHSSFKVFVDKTIDIKELEYELKKLHLNFFEKYNLKIVKGRLNTYNTLKQGEILKGNQDGEKYTGTLGGFVTKTDDERKMYALTCNHVFPKEKLLAYTDNPDKDVGTCVFTKKDSSCDFAAIEMNESFANKCDKAFRREDNKKISAKVYNESLEHITFVHKIGATTNVTKGRIISSEYYDKTLPENTFLVKGTSKTFSEPGDSGSLVFSRPRTGRQNYVNVVGMVFANSLMLYDDDDDDDSDDDQNVEKDNDLDSSQMKDVKRVEANVDKTTRSNTSFSFVRDDVQNTDTLTCCYRLQIAFAFFKEEKDVEVKFKDDLSTPSSSPDDSFEETS